MKNIIAIAVVILIGSASYGQDKGSQVGYFNWNFGPIVNNSFVKNFSGKGANLGYSIFIRKDLAVGAEVGWNNYYQYAPRQTYTTKGSALTTDMYKYVFTLPLTATITQYLHSGSIVNPYVKLGLGALYSEQDQYYNIYVTGNSNWGFLAVPEVGASIKPNPYGKLSFLVGAQYKIATNKVPAFSINNIQTFNFSAGIGLQLN